MNNIDELTNFLKERKYVLLDNLQKSNQVQILLQGDGIRYNYLLKITNSGILIKKVTFKQKKEIILARVINFNSSRTIINPYCKSTQLDNILISDIKQFCYPHSLKFIFNH